MAYYHKINFYAFSISSEINLIASDTGLVRIVAKRDRYKHQPDSFELDFSDVRCYFKERNILNKNNGFEAVLEPLF